MCSQRPLSPLRLKIANGLRRYLRILKSPSYSDALTYTTMAVCVYVCVCVCVCVYACHSTHVEVRWRSEDYFQELFLSFHHLSPKYQT